MEKGTDVELVLILPPELTSGEKCWVCCQATIVRVEEEGSEFGVAAQIRRMDILPEVTSEPGRVASGEGHRSTNSGIFSRLVVPKFILGMRKVSRSGSSEWEFFKKSFPLHRSRCNNGGPRIAILHFQVPGGPIYADRETRGRCGASADADWTAIRNAIISCSVSICSGCFATFLFFRTPCSRADSNA